MSYYQLPILPFDPNLHRWIDVRYNSQDKTFPIINKTLCNYLSNTKNCIDSHQQDWDKFKKYTNPYEYIHSVVPGLKLPICKTKPLSRSFFKMIEICRVMRLLDGLGPKIKSFHLAEGPGGFIEALSYMRNNSEDMYHGITLVDDTNVSVPGWKKSKAFLERTQNVVIDTGASGTGDLMLADNLRDFYERHNGSCEIVTGDGGFDFTTDFEHQEVVSAKLVLSQIAFAVSCQAKGGHFILKMFDTFTACSVDILCLLSIVYESVHIFKPHSSRLANSEKYIICKGFRLNNTRNLVITLFHAMKNFNSGVYIEKILTFDPSCAYRTKVEECNAILGQQQIECITQTLALIGSNNLDKLDTLKRVNIQKCASWCQKHKLPFNRIQSSLNTFGSRQNSFVRERTTNIDDNLTEINDETT